MLNEFSKEDNKWRNMAYCICKSKSLADDLTNDMYLKIYESGKKYEEINDWYVFRTIKNLWLHHLRLTNKQLDVSDILQRAIDELLSLEMTDSEHLLDSRKMINEALNELFWYHRETLLHTAERSLRKNEEYLGVTVSVLHHTRKSALKELKEIYIKKLKSA